MRNRPALGLAACAALVLATSAHAVLPIQHWQTSSGAHVYFVESRDLPMLDVSVEFPGGSVFDPPGKSGLAGMTQRLLRLGAAGIGEDEIARRIADVGARLSGRLGQDGAGLTLRTLSSERERNEALGLLARLLQHPEFPVPVLEREKARLIGVIRDADTNPETIADVAFGRLVYRDHPYALRTSGEAESVGRLSRSDLVDFHLRHYTARKAVVALIGDVSRSQAELIAEQLTRELPQEKGQGPVPSPVAPLPAASTQVISHHASQSHILIGAPGVARGDPDYIPLYVGNFVLGGGGFVSRINKEVRQKRGLAYSATSYFSPLMHGGQFTIGMQTQGERSKEALEVTRGILAEFVRSGPSEEELTAAKQNIIGSFPLRIDSNRKIHDNLALIGFYRLPLTYLEDFVRDVERVTAADIRNAFKRRVDPDRMVTVVVGGDSEPGK
jgi:zinc protease